jgi:hypothetical protein
MVEKKWIGGGDFLAELTGDLFLDNELVHMLELQLAVAGPRSYSPEPSFMIMPRQDEAQ